MKPRVYNSQSGCCTEVTLIIQSGFCGNKIILLLELVSVIYRGQKADNHLHVTQVTRFHCCIKIQPFVHTTIYLSDLFSHITPNGLFSLYCLVSFSFHYPHSSGYTVLSICSFGS